MGQYRGIEASLGSETNHTLLVEGNRFLASMLKPLLEMNGLPVVSVPTPEMAGAWLERHPDPALLVIDLREGLDSPSRWRSALHKDLCTLGVPTVILVSEKNPPEWFSSAVKIPHPVDAERFIREVSSLLITSAPPQLASVFGVELGKDWRWGARSRHVVREFASRQSAEHYLSRLEIPAGWCGALVEVESSPTSYVLGLRSVRTLLVRSGDAPAVAVNTIA